MRKVFLLGLAMLLLGSFLFADDAMVMPARMGRFYLAPSFISSNDGVGDIKGREGELTMFNLGAALEHGLNDWITLALQWAPGVNLSSEINQRLPMVNPISGELMYSEKMQLEDMGDLVVGAKVQVIGSAAPVRSETMRLAFAPGVYVPLSDGPDFEKEAEKIGKLESFTPTTLDNHVWGFGMRTYFDYIFSERFFINFYNEFSYYPFKRDVTKLGLTEYGTMQAINAGYAEYGTTVSGEGNFQYDLTFEIEPRYLTSINEGTILAFGLPFVYQTVPEVKYDFTAEGPAAALAVADAEQYFSDMSVQSHIVSINPGIAVFFTNWALPVQFKLTYNVPVWGENAAENRVLGLQARFYYRI